MNTVFFFFNITSTTEIYTLSLHDALPIYVVQSDAAVRLRDAGGLVLADLRAAAADDRSHLPQARSEEHTSELQSHVNLVCRLLLEKKKIFFFKFNDYSKHNASAKHRALVL